MNHRITISYETASGNYTSLNHFVDGEPCSSESLQEAAGLVPDGAVVDSVEVKRGD